MQGMIFFAAIPPSLPQVAAVERFINSVDSQMRQRQEQQKLATISARIDSYEAVEGSSEEVEKVGRDLRDDLQHLPLRSPPPHAFLFFLSFRSSRSSTAST